MEVSNAKNNKFPGTNHDATKLQNLKSQKPTMVSAKNIHAHRQSRAGIYVLILLTSLTISWIWFVIVLLHDFNVHYHIDGAVKETLAQYNCSEEVIWENFPNFPKMRYVT